MRLPPEMEEGSFSLECPNCEKDLDIEIRSRRKADESIRINGKPYTPRSKPLEMEKPRKADVIPVETKLDLDLPYRKRMRIIFIVLLIVGMLGMISSFSTIVGTFSIYDLEEKSPNKLVTLSVWVIDAESGRPLENVNISLTGDSGNFSGTSNDQGLTVIEDIISGEMELTVSKEGYKTVRSAITIKKGSPNVVDIPMERGSEEEELPILVHQFRIKKYSGLYTNVAASLMFLASLMALISAFFVYRKEFFSLTLFCAFLSIFSFGFLIGSILALMAVVLIIFSYHGFSHTHTLLEMLDRMRKENLRPMLKSRDKKLPGLPPVRKGK